MSAVYLSQIAVLVVRPRDSGAAVALSLPVHRRVQRPILMLVVVPWNAWPRYREEQIRRDLATNKFEWDHPQYQVAPPSPKAGSRVTVHASAYEAAVGASAIAIITEWDEFKTLDYKKVYDSMQKPAFIFDGRNILDVAKLREIGFIVYSIGKPLDPFV